MLSQSGGKCKCFQKHFENHVLFKSIPFSPDLDKKAGKKKVLDTF